MKGKGHVRHLIRSLKRLGRSLGKRKRDAIAWQAMGDFKIRTHVLTILGRDIRKEMNILCSAKKPSTLRSSTPAAAASFDWSKLESELELNAPSLFSILKSATTMKIPPSRMKKKVVE